MVLTTGSVFTSRAGAPGAADSLRYTWEPRTSSSGFGFQLSVSAASLALICTPDGAVFTGRAEVRLFREPTGPAAAVGIAGVSRHQGRQDAQELELAGVGAAHHELPHGPVAQLGELIAELDQQRFGVYHLLLQVRQSRPQAERLQGTDQVVQELAQRVVTLAERQLGDRVVLLPEPGRQHRRLARACGRRDQDQFDPDPRSTL